MTRLRMLVSRLWGRLRARRLDQDLEEQIASHLDEAADDYVRQGLSPEDARRMALRQFGSISRAQEAWRDARSLLSLDHLQRDLRYAVRGLRRHAGFSLAVLIVLALGTGAVTSVFALLDAVVFRPLPFAESERLAVIRHRAPGLGLDDAGLSNVLYFTYAQHAESFDGLAVYRDTSLVSFRLPGGRAERVLVSHASAAVFTVLRTAPALGRLFTEADGLPGFASMRWQIPVLLSHQFWVERFGQDPNIIGRVLTTTNDSPREVVGVLPRGFAFPRPDIQMWILVEPRKSTGPAAQEFSWNVLARLRPGVAASSAEAELTQVLDRIKDADPTAAKARLSPVVTPLKSAVIGDVAQVIWLLFGGMALLLLVAVANAGGLFLVRAEHRRREMAVRRALGAHGPHLASLLLTEALMLTSVAAAIGLCLAHGILSAAIAFAPFEIPRAAEVGLDGRAVLFAATMAVLMASFYTALTARRGQPLTTGQAGGLWATGRRPWGSDALIALQVAVALTLMVGSALMVQTYRHLSQRALGFSPEDVLTMEIGLPSRKAGQHARIYQDVVEHIRRLALVDDASAASFAPLTAAEHVFPVEAGAAPVPFKFFVPGYFQAMGTPILHGEAFAPGHRSGAPHPVLVSNALARRLYPDQSAVGKTVRRLNEDGSPVELGRGPVPPFTIVGVVADVRETTLRDNATEIVYIPAIDPPVEQSIVPTSMRLVVRARPARLPLAAALRAAIADVDPDLSVGRIETMDSIVASARARETFVGALLLVAAAASLLLGAIGIYGSVAQIAKRRTREIAIRLALGADRASVVRMVVAGSGRAVIAGGCLGLAVSLLAARTLGALLFGVGAHDPIVFGTVTGMLLSVAGIAAFLAARHAARVAPLVALRID